MQGICKRFGTVLANDRVDLTLYPGDILGLLGENGAGKTTLMNVLFGVYTADAGRIRLEGREVAIRHSADALKLGIGMVHQHFHLVPRHTVLENLMVGQTGGGWRLDRGGVQDRMAEIEDQFGLRLAPDALVADLTIGQQQRLEIVKALVRGARVLILDEPTASLTPQEADGLFEALEAMAGLGMGVIFISHKLNEVRRLTSRIQILRQGRVVAAMANEAGLTRRRLAEMMCDCEIEALPKPPVAAGRPLLSVENLGTAAGAGARLDNVSLTVHAGEILGIAGVSGNGQSELAEVLAGMLPAAAGSVVIDGQRVRRISPRRVQSLGVGRIPEDRLGTGLIPSLPLSRCMVLPRLGERRFNRWGFLRHGAIRRFVLRQVTRFDIRTPGTEVRTGNLSGGNLQKALLARELAWDPLVLVAAQPTRGLDVAAARFVHERFLDLRSRQRAVLLISEDLEELFALCDRIAVMYEGRIMDTLPAAGATVRSVGLLMAGVKDAA